MAFQTTKENMEFLINTDNWITIQKKPIGNYTSDSFLLHRCLSLWRRYGSTVADQGSPLLFYFPVH